MLVVVSAVTGVDLLRGCPGGQQPESVVGRGARHGGEGDELQAAVGGEVPRLDEIEVADDRVVNPLQPGPVIPDVVGGPPDPELVVAGDQLIR